MLESKTINRIKNTCFEILGTILKKMDANLNLFNTQIYLAEALSRLCGEVLKEVIYIGESYTSLVQEYDISKIVSEMLFFLA